MAQKMWPTQARTMPPTIAKAGTSMIGSRFAALVLLGAISLSATAADRPNILWLTAEDMSPHLGCYGDAEARTPKIDAFARTAVRRRLSFGGVKAAPTLGVPPFGYAQ